MKRGRRGGCHSTNTLNSCPEEVLAFYERFVLVGTPYYFIPEVEAVTGSWGSCEL